MYRILYTPARVWFAGAGKPLESINRASSYADKREAVAVAEALGDGWKVMDVIQHPSDGFYVRPRGESGWRLWVG